jgi:hypothetical protein
MVIDTLQPAAQTADHLSSLTIKLKREIDSKRRGHAVEPIQTLDALIASAMLMKKELRRAA